MLNMNEYKTEKKKIIVTGGTGFIGSHLLNSLQNRSDIILLKRSNSNISRIEELIPRMQCINIDNSSIDEIFKKHQIGGIIHLATDYGKNNSTLDSMLEANIILPCKLLDCGIKNGISFFINTHTFANNQYNLYSAMKHSFLKIGKYYTNKYKLKFINMQLEYVYGPGDDNSKFVPFIFTNMVAETQIDATSCEQRRDFIYINDVIKAYLLVLKKIDQFSEGFFEFQIGLGKSLSFKEFIHLIETLWGKKGIINYGKIPYNKNEIFESHANTVDAINLLDWSPDYGYERGIQEMIHFYEDF